MGGNREGAQSRPSGPAGRYSRRGRLNRSAPTEGFGASRAPTWMNRAGTATHIQLLAQLCPQPSELRHGRFGSGPADYAEMDSVRTWPSRATRHWYAPGGNGGAPCA